MWNFKANTSEMAKKISSGQENLRFQMLSCTQSGIQEVRLNWRHSVFQSISQRMKSAVQLCVKPGRKSSIPHLRNCLSKQRHLLPKISGFTDIICMQWTGWRESCLKLRNYPQNTAKLKSVKRRYFTQYQLLIFWMRCSYVLNFILELPMKENSPARWLMLWHKMYITKMSHKYGYLTEDFRL